MPSAGLQWTIETREYTMQNTLVGQSPTSRSLSWKKHLDAPLNDGHMWPNNWDVLATRHRGSGGGFGINGQGNPRETAGLGNILMGDARVETWSKQKFKTYGYQKGNSRLWKPYGKVTQPSP